MLQKKSQRLIVFVVFVFASLGLLFACTKDVSLGIAELPTKVEYVRGESLDLSGGKLLLKFSGEEVDILMTDSHVFYTGFDPMAIGNQTVTLSYSFQKRTLTVNFSVTVIEKAPEKPVRIFIKSPPTVHSYVEGQAFLAAGLEIEAILKDETKIPVTDGYTLSVGETVTLADSGSVTVTYQGLTATFYILVVKREIIGLSLGKIPDKTKYQSGETVDLCGAQVFYKMNDGTIKLVAIDTELTIKEPILLFGMKNIVLTDGKYNLEIPVEVSKVHSLLDWKADIRAKLDEIANLSGAFGAYKNATFSFFLRNTKNLDIGGIRYALSADGVLFPRAKQIKIEEEIVASEFPSFEIEREAGTDKIKIKFNLLFLQSFATENLMIETDEEIYTVNIFVAEESKSKIEISGENLTFPGWTDHKLCYVVQIKVEEAQIDVVINRLLWDGDICYIPLNLVKENYRIWIGAILAESAGS